jgi:hypothetical protein
VPTAFAADVVCRPLIMLAAWLIVLQAFLAGVATAQAALKLAVPSQAGAICHGASSAAPSIPDADETKRLCCAFCATSPFVAAADASEMTPVISWNQAASAALTHFTVVLARGAVRAGPSQAPPRLA